MYRRPPACDFAHEGFPRTRGDVPIGKNGVFPLDPFPPHTRGCTPGGDLQGRGRRVSPAHAGMYRFLEIPKGGYMCFPRTRGDVPYAGRHGSTGCEFPPHTRGCTREEIPWGIIVSPAHAGMYPVYVLRYATRCCFPRTRGDVPGLSSGEGGLSVFPPHTRGCTPNALSASI